MTEQEVIDAFEDDSNDDLYLKFEQIPNDRKLSNRPDLNAFLLLDSLVPRLDEDIINGAEHDEFYLQPSAADLAAAGITIFQIQDLIRSGVRYESEYCCLAMYA